MYKRQIENLHIFDMITLFHVLEHVPDLRSLLKSCHSWLSSERLLQTAGFLAIESTPDPDYYVATGFNRLKAGIYYYYYCSLTFLQIFKLNVYDTILRTAGKTHIKSENQSACGH